MFVSLFGEIVFLPFRPILYAGKGGLWMFVLLLLIACHGAASVWLAWRLCVKLVRQSCERTERGDTVTRKSPPP